MDNKSNSNNKSDYGDRPYDPNPIHLNQLA